MGFAFRPPTPYVVEIALGAGKVCFDHSSLYPRDLTTRIYRRLKLNLPGRMIPHRSSGDPRVCRTDAFPLVGPLRHGLRHSLADVTSCAGALGQMTRSDMGGEARETVRA